MPKILATYFPNSFPFYLKEVAELFLLLSLQSSGEVGEPKTGQTSTLKLENPLAIPEIES